MFLFAFYFILFFLFVEEVLPKSRISGSVFKKTCCQLVNNQSLIGLYPPLGICRDPSLIEQHRQTAFGFTKLLSAH